MTFVATNYIGPQPFVRLSLPGARNDGVEVVYQHGNIIQREGVDGTAYMQTGIKGDVFTLESFVDVATFAEAQALKVVYKTLVGTNLYDVAVGGVSYHTEFGHKYIVLDVKAECEATGVACGGICVSALGVASPGDPAYARLTATWTLVPVFVGIPVGGP